MGQLNRLINYLIFSLLQDGKDCDSDPVWVTLDESAVVISDGLHCFQAVAVSGAAHQAHRVGSGRQSVEHIEFRRVNMLLGNLKTSISGTYHAFDFRKYAHRYLAEVQYRFNRRFRLAEMLPRLLRASVLAQPYSESALRLEVARVC